MYETKELTIKADYDQKLQEMKQEFQTGAKLWSEKSACSLGV